MNSFQNSRSAAWRGRQTFQNNSCPQNTPRPDGAGMPDNPSPDEAGQNRASAQDPSSGQSWMENAALAGIDPAKLQMLSSLASQAQGKNQNELLPFLMAAASQSKTNGMSFGPDEIDTIIHVMKAGKSPQEVQQIDRICALMRQFGAMRGPNRR